ncbi:MAG TPA: WD40 repeat domain-containing protein [Candidatus Xenobia bacterium]|nr:WD40 repeat domain-containing protein [Candidatus Xenobia bacterium]
MTIVPGPSLNNGHRPPVTTRSTRRRLLLAACALLLSSPGVSAQERGATVVEWAPDGNVIIAARGLLGRFSLDSPQEELLDKSGVTFALSPDGARLAVAGRDRLEIRRYNDWSVEATYGLPEGEGPRELVTVAWSPDGRTLAGGSRTGHLLLWDMGSQELWADLGIEPPTALVHLAFSADSVRLLAAFDDGRAILWDLEQKKEVGRYGTSRSGQESSKAETESLFSALSPDGRRVLANYFLLAPGEHRDVKNQVEEEFAVLDDGGRELWHRAGSGVEFTRGGDGVLALVPPFRIVALYRADNGENLRVFEPPEFVRSLYLVRQSPDGTKLLGIGTDETSKQVMVVWDFATARVLKTRR